MLGYKIGWDYQTTDPCTTLHAGLTNMDWARVPLERLFGFLAALVPGCATLLLFAIHEPDLLWRFWALAALGYQTKITVVLLCCFLSGWTIISAFQGLNGAIGGVLGGVMKIPEPTVKPWENANWRALMAAYLGNAAPKDIQPIAESTFEWQLLHAEQFPEPEKRKLEARSAKLAADMNNGEWRQWWDHLKYRAIMDHGPIASMSLTLGANFEAATLILLCSLPFTPSLRRWWLITGCVFWMLAYLAEGYSIISQLRDPWRCFYSEMEYLHKRVAKQESQGE